MGAGEILLMLLLIAVCGIAVFVIIKMVNNAQVRSIMRNAAREEEEKRSMYGRMAAHGTTDIPAQPVPTYNSVNTGPMQLSIYEFHSHSEVSICPVCDGENKVTAKFCHICGQELSK